MRIERTRGSVSSELLSRGARSAISTIRLASSGSGERRAARLRRRRAALMSLADRRRVLDAAFRPQTVEAALDLERGIDADIALEYLAIIADGLDDVNDPIVGEAEALAERALDAKHAPHLGARRLHHFIDVALGDAEFLGVDQRVECPLHDIEPLVVAVADERAEWLLRDDLGQDHVLVGLGELELLRVELGGV